MHLYYPLQYQVNNFFFFYLAILILRLLTENTVCVAQSVGEWYRAMVLSTDLETNTSYVAFLDYGGFAYVENVNLRQIRGDFMLLPFQAAECFLANIRPKGGKRCY